MFDANADFPIGENTSILYFLSINFFKLDVIRNKGNYTNLINTTMTCCTAEILQHHEVSVSFAYCMQAPKEEPAVEKTVSKAGAKAAAKKGKQPETKVTEVAIEEAVDPVAEKLRQQR